MKVTLNFPASKATYGLLFGIAKFTTSSATLKEILKAINKHCCFGNFKRYCADFYDSLNVIPFEDPEYNNEDWRFRITLMVVANPHSTYSIHKSLLKDADPDIRRSVAEHTRYPKLLTYICNHSKDIHVLTGLFLNPKLTQHQFDIIFHRLLYKGLIEKLFWTPEYYTLINDGLFKSPYMTDEKNNELEPIADALFRQM